MTGASLLVLCADAECRRTIAQAASDIAPLCERPPAEGSWLLIAEASLGVGARFDNPPLHTLLLGNEEGEASSGLSVESVALPLRLRDLRARLAALASALAPSPLLLPGGTLRLDTALRQVAHPASGEVRELTEKETLLLRALAGADGAPLSRETLLAEVWAYQPEVNTRTLETHISRLRAKLQHFPDSGVVIEVQEGAYRLVENK